MKWGFLFLGLILLGLLFELAEGWADKKYKEVDLFWGINARMNPSSYVYYNNETLERIILALFIRYLMSFVTFIRPFRYFATAFAILEAIDLIDFWITGNTLWFEYYGWPVTYNIIKFLVFTLLMIYGICKAYYYKLLVQR